MKNVVLCAIYLYLWDIPSTLHTQVANTKESVFQTCNRLQVLDMDNNIFMELKCWYTFFIILG